MDVSGNLFVADPGNSVVKEVLAANGSQVTLATVDKSLTGVAVDKNGNVYFSDSNSPIMTIPVGGGPIFPISPTLVGHNCVAADVNVYTNNGANVDQVPVGYYTVSPALPAGLTIDPTLGNINSTPLNIAAAAKLYRYCVQQQRPWYSHRQHCSRSRGKTLYKL